MPLDRQAGARSHQLNRRHLGPDPAQPFGAGFGEGPPLGQGGAKRQGQHHLPLGPGYPQRHAPRARRAPQRDRRSVVKNQLSRHPVLPIPAKAFDTPGTLWQGNPDLPDLWRKENTMPKEEWGTKRLCPVCAARFYDLRNDPMTCPACGTEHFPRVDPVVIMLPVYKGGAEPVCLLGRQASWPPGRMSALAGFLEPAILWLSSGGFLGPGHLPVVGL